jgi:hypothetical protein
VWDAKRQAIWLATALVIGTVVVYKDAHDETGRFDPSVFAFWEVVFLIIVAVMFYIYSRQKP